MSRLGDYAYYALFVLGKAMWWTLCVLSAPIWIPCAALIISAGYDCGETPWNNDRTP